MANHSVIYGVLPTRCGVTHKVVAGYRGKDKLWSTDWTNCCVQRTRLCGTPHSMSSMGCLKDKNSILNMSDL